MTDTMLGEVTGLMRDLFDEFDGPITRDTRARDVPQWDSLAHVQLLVKIEQLFRIRFGGNEVHDAKCLGDLLDAIERKRALSG